MRVRSPFCGMTKSSQATIVFFLLVAFILPHNLGGQWTKVFTSAACASIAIAGVGFLYGRVGMVNLAQYGLMGVGGWVTLRLNHGFDLLFEVNMAISGTITMAFGVLLALPALRMRGLYLTLVTMMAAAGFEIFFAAFRFPNGGPGFWGIQTALDVSFRRPSLAQSDTAYLSYVIVVAAFSFLFIEANRRWSPGRAWALIKKSEAAAMSAAVNVTAHKIWAFALSGLLAGIAGSLLAGSIGVLDAGSFRASESILLFGLAVVGGTNYWLGAVIACLLFKALPPLLNDWGLDADLAPIIFGAGLLHALITAPNGIAGQVYSYFQSHSQAREKSQPNEAIRQLPDISVDIRELSVRFGGVVALDNLNVEFSKPVVGIIGPNGAGKTTLMNCLSGFVDATGKITMAGTDLLSLPPHRRSAEGLRRSFQKEEIANDLSVEDNVRVQLDGLDYSVLETASEIDKVIDFVGMSDKSHKYGSELNNFERRLVDLAKCLVGRPIVVMLDEPAGGLSAAESRRLGELIKKIHDLTGAMTLLIDHDVELVSEVCDETLVLDFGKKIAFGKTKEVLNDPRVEAAYLGVDEV